MGEEDVESPKDKEAGSTVMCQRPIQRSVCVCLVAFFLCWSGLDPVWAFEVRVRGSAQISVDVRPAGTTLRVSGLLLDELGEPLPQREVYFGFRGFVPESDEVGQLLITDAWGMFSSAPEVPPGKYRWKVEFPESAHLVGDQRSGVFQTQAKTPTLVALVPRRVHAQEAAVAYLRSSVDGMGVPLTLTVSVNAEDVGSLRLDTRGLGTFDVAPHLRPGRNDVVFVAPASPYRAAVEERARVRLLDTLTVDAEGQEYLLRLTRGVEVTGVLADSNGPVMGLDLEVLLKGAERTRKIVTRSDSAGRFEAFFPRTENDEGIWRPEVVVRAGTSDPLREILPAIELAKIRSSRILQNSAWILLVVLLVFGAFRGLESISWRWVRKAGKREREVALEEALEVSPRLAWSPGVETQEAATDRLISGVIWDRWRKCPVITAKVEIRPREGRGRSWRPRRGDFSFGDLDHGAHTLHFEAPGFLPGAIDVEVPHDGCFRNMRVDLVAVPLQIRELYRAWSKYASGDDPWGRSTPREIEKLVAEALDRSVASLSIDERRDLASTIRGIVEGRAETGSSDGRLEALTAVVEDAYFGGRSVEIEAWRFASELVKGLRSRHSFDGGK
jgi:hypothetical protein